MKQSLRIALASLLFCLCMGTVVMAHPPVAPCDRGPCPGMLSITAEQRAKYYAIMDEFAPKMQQINDQIFVKKNELEALKHAVQPDVAAVRVAATELTQLRAARRDLQKALDERLAKECGIVRPQKPIPGVDRPFPGPRGPHGPQGPHGFGPGPHGPHAGPGPHGPCPGAPLD